jgi:cytochrome c553
MSDETSEKPVRSESIAKLGKRWSVAGFSAMVLLTLGVWLVDAPSAQDGKAPVTMDKAFPNSNKCKRCHERVFEEWETSPLSRSIHSPAFRTALDAFLASPAGKDKALCFRCHAPHVREFSDQVQLFIDQAKSGDPQMDGVACAQCHLIKQVDRTKQPPEPKYEPAGSKTLYGPYKDFAQNLAHQSMELGLFRKSDLS